MSTEPTARNRTPRPTKGPWVEFSDQDRTVAILPAGRAGEVCAFATPYPSRANARLIASAPDLLAALKSLAANVAAGSHNHQFATETLQAALAVIARAEGR